MRRVQCRATVAVPKAFTSLIAIAPAGHASRAVHDPLADAKATCAMARRALHPLPCCASRERFASVLDQVSLLPMAPSEMGQSFAGGRHNDTAGFVKFAAGLLDGCAGDDVGCAVRHFNAKIKGDTRIFLYPQAYFINAIQPAESIVCYDHDRLGERLDAFFNERTKCKAASKPVFGKEMVKRNSRHHETLVVSKQQQHWCQRVRQIYARDAQLWDAHCG